MRVTKPMPAPHRGHGGGGLARAAASRSRSGCSACSRRNVPTRAAAARRGLARPPRSSAHSARAARGPCVPTGCSAAPRPTRLPDPLRWSSRWRRPPGARRIVSAMPLRPRPDSSGVFQRGQPGRRQRSDHRQTPAADHAVDDPVHALRRRDRHVGVRRQRCAGRAGTTPRQGPRRAQTERKLKTRRGTIMGISARHGIGRARPPLSNADATVT